MTTNSIDGNVVNKTSYQNICKLVDISMLASFMRDFPLNNLTAEERERVLDFERYMTKLENRLFSELGIY